MQRRPLGNFLKKIQDWVRELRPLLLPPFAELKDDKLLELVKTELEADAAALFLSNVNDPNELLFRWGVGYEQEYRKQKYYIGTQALTSHVFRHQLSINKSAAELASARTKGPKNDIPFTARCQGYISTKEFKNIIAVPLVFEENALGVLKIENKRGTTRNDPFPEEDFELAKILADTITIILQQQQYNRLWTDGEVAMANCRTPDQYLNQVVQILIRSFNAECCSIFLQEGVNGQKVLRFRCGNGYQARYMTHQYELPEKGQPANSFTAHVAQKRTCLCKKDSELEAGTIPYSGACCSYIQSGTFRNILAVALVESEADFDREDAECYGVLKVENRKPEPAHFGKYDIEVCKAFVTRQVLPTLTKFQITSTNGSQPSRRATKNGGEILRTEFGSEIPNDQTALRQLFTKVIDFQEKRKDVNNKDCSEYLRLKHATYYRWRRDFRNGNFLVDFVGKTATDS